MKQFIRAGTRILFCVFLVLALAGCSKMEMNITEARLKVGEIYHVIVTTGDTPVVYDSSDPAILTVDENGIVTGLSEGMATVTAVNAKGQSAHCVITVERVEPTGISFYPDSYTLSPEETAAPELSFRPANTTWFAVSYSSDDETVATVEADGTIRAVGGGEAVVTATTENGHTAECRVTVRPYAESIQMEPSLSLITGDTATLKVRVSPENCAKEDLLWSSSDETVARVRDGVVTAVSAGSATVTARTERSERTAECKVVVRTPGLSIDGVAKSCSVMRVDDQYELAYTLNVKTSGGTGDGCMFKFDLIQEDMETWTSGWINENSISGQVTGYGTCVMRITVQDQGGETVWQDCDLLE